MLRSVNRVLTGLTGLVLLLLGLAVLAGGLDLMKHVDRWTPSGWPWNGPSDVLLSRSDRTTWREESWWWPAVIAALAVLVVLLLWWLLAQFRRHRLREVLVDSGDGEGALLRGRAMENVLAAEAESLPGVDRARVTLVGRRSQPQARIGLLLAAHAEPGPEVHRLRTEAIEHARASAGIDELPAEVRLRGAKHRAERVN